MKLPSRRWLTLLVAAALASPLVAGSPAATARPATAKAPASVPRFSHVVEVFLENESAGSTWEDPAAAPHLAVLRRANTYVPGFWATGHASLTNYEAAFAAVESTSHSKVDCLGMPYGTCIYPATVPTIARLLDRAGRSWRVYAEGMRGAPGGGPCLHSPSRDLPDPYQGPFTNGYATRHNPAPWFDDVLSRGPDEAYCKAHVLDLSDLWTAAGRRALPTFSFVVPDTCHDGHDTGSMGGCALDPEGPGAPSGVAAIDAWLPGFVGRLTHSRGWDSHSLLFVTFDEGGATDSSGCVPCRDTSAGGRIGAVVISGLAKARYTSAWQGDHYAFLRTLEAAYGLPTLESSAVDAAAAASVHDGDPGVGPLVDAWRRA